MFSVTNAISGMTAWNFSPTLSGLRILNERKPRVALARNPYSWAEGSNPIGIQSGLKAHTSFFELDEVRDPRF
jgi:hypothetical protein